MVALTKTIKAIIITAQIIKNKTKKVSECLIYIVIFYPEWMMELAL